MPKLKTNKSAAKRFKKTASGGHKRGQANHNHILTKKRPGRKARLVGKVMVNKNDNKAVKRMLSG